MANRIRFSIRSDSTSNWQRVNPVLSLYEMAYDTTARRLKAGDGYHKWSELPYLKPDIIDNLTSTSIEDALSANMGKYLKALHDTLRADHEALKKLHNALRSEFDTLKADFNIVKADHYALKNSHNALQADHDTLKANHNALQAAHDNLQNDHNKLKDLVNTKASQADLNALTNVVNTKVSQTDLSNHINSSNPHPNWKPSFSDISGILDASRVSGKLSNANIDTGNVNGLKGFVEALIPAQQTPNLSFSNISGNLDGSRVVGNLPNATIPVDNIKGKIDADDITNLTTFIRNTNINTSNITNLTQFVQNLIDNNTGSGGGGGGSGGDSGSSGDGITDKNLSENGYAKFANGLMVQWGKHAPTGGTGFDTSASGGTISFPTAFSSKCFALIHSFHPSVGHTNLNWQTASVSAPDKTGFTISINEWRDNARSSASSGWSVTYIAIGM